MADGDEDDDDEGDTEDVSERVEKILPCEPTNWNSLKASHKVEFIQQETLCDLCDQSPGDGLLKALLGSTS